MYKLWWRWQDGWRLLTKPAWRHARVDKTPQQSTPTCSRWLVIKHNLNVWFSDDIGLNKWIPSSSCQSKEASSQSKDPERNSSSDVQSLLTSFRAGASFADVDMTAGGFWWSRLGVMLVFVYSVTMALDKWWSEVHCDRLLPLRDHARWGGCGTNLQFSSLRELQLRLFSSLWSLTLTRDWRVRRLSSVIETSRRCWDVQNSGLTVERCFLNSQSTLDKSLLC